MRPRGAAVSLEAVDPETEFNRWVAERLAGWPTNRILELERWLLEEGGGEFLPAVRNVLWERALDPELTAA
jgi:hypothetical protein